MRRNSFTNGANFRQKPGMDRGPAPCIVNIPLAARQNTAFRTALWTGCHLQTTLMCIPPCGEIGPDVPLANIRAMYEAFREYGTYG